LEYYNNKYYLLTTFTDLLKEESTKSFVREVLYLVPKLCIDLLREEHERAT